MNVEFGTSPSSALDRFASREPWTQSLSFVSGLQDRGWACLVAGASFMVVQSTPEGAVARMQRARVIDVRQIQTLCSRMPLVRVVVEPAASGVLIDVDGQHHRWAWDRPEEGLARAAALGWVPNERPIAHTKTSVIDLAPSLELVVASFSTVARRNARSAAAAEVHYEVVSAAGRTPQFQRDLAELNRDFLAARPGLKDESIVRGSVIAHFFDRGFLVSARHRRRLVGVVFLLIHDRVAYYFAAQSRDPAAALRVPTGLVVESIKLAKDLGCDLFDFVGLFDDRYPHRHRTWKGFTAFKQRFGGASLRLHPGFVIPTGA